MKIVKRGSLAETLDTLNEFLFFGKRLPKSEKLQVARWLAKRQGLSNSYANMFAPTKKDLKGVRLFAGERLTSGGMIRHVLGEEACRALILLGIEAKDVKDPLMRATEGMLKRIKIADHKGRIKGTYCCGTCTVSYWRHLSVGGLINQEEELQAGIKRLKIKRRGEGRWWSYPFYYTLFALSEIDLPSAVREMRYAALVIERNLKRRLQGSKFDRRRRLLMERILARC